VAIALLLAVWRLRVGEKNKWEEDWDILLEQTNREREMRIEGTVASGFRRICEGVYACTFAECLMEVWNRNQADGS
jgi:hypothetical protein